MTNGPNPVEILAPTYVDLDNSNNLAVTGFDFAFGDDGVALGVNVWGYDLVDA